VSCPADALLDQPASRAHAHLFGEAAGEGVQAHVGAGVKAGLGTYFEQFPQLSVSPKRVIAEGDLVAVHSHYVDTPGERGQAVLELFRVRDGKIVEHWAAVQDLPESSASHNTMF